MDPFPRLSAAFSEPLWQAGGREIGCRVAGFKRLEDGTVGQAELMGSVRPGDVVAEIDGAPVGEMSFDKVSRVYMPRTFKSRVA